MPDSTEQTLEQLAFHAPPGVETPSLLRELVRWGFENGDGLGYFSWEGDRLEDWYVEDGSRRASAIYSFLRTSDGSRIGWWRPEGQPLSDAPIVLFGGEGDFALLGAGLEDFLTRWAISGIDVHDLKPEPDDETYTANIAARERLRGWLTQRGVSCDGPRPSLEDRTAEVEAWFTSWSADRLRFAATDENRIAMAACLRDLIGVPVDKWKRTFADAIVTANQCQLFGTLVGQRPLEVSPAMETALRQFRDRDAAELPEAGLWFRATLKLDPHGVLAVSRHYIDLPNPNELQLDLDGVRKDLARRPRSPYWVPRWLTP